ncbi:Mov34/MPN/PAD-1 family protein [Arthrobacter sp. Cr_A7]|uniref:Mov34/MPN/PAD-1 family protein n=1 Tax=Arthrobacter sp. Cr_A7 TaxID=3031017 RepID=UPI0023DB0045|nr:Mov34/MPN/PAD-1 family protein [Arthrobacter sp. Cr_A7]MDF2048861.1 Mov34/MPN/PAD-1 family protein [Arthrobacter sp. Cr_A7]
MRERFTVEWGEGLRSSLTAEACKAFPKETGGLLMGNWQDRTALITHVIGPGPNADHKDDAFTPDRDWQYGEIDKLFTASKGSIEYLGDWHTHPKGISYPSETDVDLLTSIAISAESRCPRPLMCILSSPTNKSWSERTFLYTRDLFTSDSPFIYLDI